jgi:hypothetical protein
MCIRGVLCECGFFSFFLLSFLFFLRGEGVLEREGRDCADWVYCRQQAVSGLTTAAGCIPGVWEAVYECLVRG